MNEDNRWWSFSVNDSGEDAKRIFRVWAESAWRDKVSFEALLLPVSRCYLACFRLDDDGARFTLGLGPLAFLTLRARSWRASARDLVERIVGKSFGGREVRFAMHDDGVWWNLWTEGDSWNSSIPRWREGCFRPLDALLGPEKMSDERVLRKVDTFVPLPEKNYRARVTLSEYTWSRPRWFKPKPRRSAYVDLIEPIPTDNKGPYRGMSTAAWSVGDAIGAVVGSVLRRRGVKHVPHEEPAPVGQA